MSMEESVQHVVMMAIQEVSVKITQKIRRPKGRALYFFFIDLSLTSPFKFLSKCY